MDSNWLAWFAKSFKASVAHRWTIAVLAVGLMLWRFATSEFPSGVIGGLVVLLAADWIFGTARAWRTRSLSRKGAYAGVVKTLTYLVLIAVTNHLARVTLGAAWDLLTNGLLALVSAMLLLTEAISVLMHVRDYAGTYGVTVPVVEVVLRRLEQESDRLTRGEEVKP